MSNLTTKRFVIRKSLIGKNTIITFTTKKGTFTTEINYVNYWKQNKYDFNWIIYLSLINNKNNKI